jgi:flavorubredoxin
MATYSEKDKLLLPNDAFGQHIASSQRFDDELGWSWVRKEAAKYYANIVLPYGDQVQKALDAVNALSFDMIAPSHGIIWRTHLKDIIKDYQQWSSFTPEKKAVIIYDTMWGSTKTLAYHLAEGISSAGIPVTLRNLTTTHYSDIVTDIMEAQLVCLGSPTLNNGMMPSMGELLTYVKGLRPQKKIGFFFGSYGWGGQAVSEMKTFLEPLHWDFPLESYKVNYVPKQHHLEDIQKKGRELAHHVKKKKP